MNDSSPRPESSAWKRLGPAEMRFQPVGLESVIRPGASVAIHGTAQTRVRWPSGPDWIDPYAGTFLPRVDWPSQPSPPLPPEPEMPTLWRQGLAGAGLGGYGAYVSYRMGFVSDEKKKMAWEKMKRSLPDALATVQSYGYSGAPSLNGDYDVEVALITDEWLNCKSTTKQFLDKLYDRSVLLMVLELMDNDLDRGEIGDAVAVVGTSFDAAYAAAGEPSARVADA